MSTLQDYLERASRFQDNKDKTAFTDSRDIRQANPFAGGAISDTTPKVSLFADTSHIVPRNLPIQAGELPSMAAQTAHLMTQLGRTDIEPRDNPAIIELVATARHIRTELSAPTPAAKQAYAKQFGFEGRDPNAQDRTDTTFMPSTRLSADGRNHVEVPDAAVEHVDLALDVARARIGLRAAIAASPDIPQTSYSRTLLEEGVTAHAIQLAVREGTQTSGPVSDAMPSDKRHWTTEAGKDTSVRPEFAAAWALPETRDLQKRISTLHGAMTGYAETYNAAHGLSAADQAHDDNAFDRSKGANPHDSVGERNVASEYKAGQDFNRGQHNDASIRMEDLGTGAGYSIASDAFGERPNVTTVRPLDPANLTKTAIDTLPIQNLGEKEFSERSLDRGYEVIASHNAQSQVLKAFIDATVKLDQTPGKIESMGAEDWKSFSAGVSRTLLRPEYSEGHHVDYSTTPKLNARQAMSNIDSSLRDNRTREGSHDPAMARPQHEMVDFTHYLVTFVADNPQATPSAISAETTGATLREAIGMRMRSPNAAAKTAEAMSRFGRLEDLSDFGAKAATAAGLPEGQRVTRDGAAKLIRQIAERAEQDPNGQPESRLKSLGSLLDGAGLDGAPTDRRNFNVLSTTIAYASNNPIGWSEPDKKALFVALSESDYSLDTNGSSGRSSFWSKVSTADIRRNEQRLAAASDVGRFLDETSSTSRLGRAAVATMMRPLTDVVADFDRVAGPALIRAVAGPENVSDAQASTLMKTFGRSERIRTFGRDLTLDLALPATLDRTALDTVLREQANLDADGRPLGKGTAKQIAVYHNMRDVTQEYGQTVDKSGRLPMDVIAPTILFSHNGAALQRDDDERLRDVSLAAIRSSGMAPARVTAVSNAVTENPENLVSSTNTETAARRTAVLAWFSTPGEAIRHATGPVEAGKQATTEDARAGSRTLAARLTAMDRKDARTMVSGAFEDGLTHDGGKPSALQYQTVTSKVSMRKYTRRAGLSQYFNSIRNIEGVEGQLYYGNRDAIGGFLAERRQTEASFRPLVSFTPPVSPFGEALKESAERAGYTIIKGHVSTSSYTHQVMGERTHIEDTKEAVFRGSARVTETRLQYVQNGETRTFDPQRPPEIKGPTLFIFDPHDPKTPKQMENADGVRIERPSNKEQMDRVALASSLTGRLTAFADTSRARSDSTPFEIAAAHETNTRTTARMVLDHEAFMDHATKVRAPVLIDRSGKEMGVELQLKLMKDHGNRQVGAHANTLQQLDGLNIHAEYVPALVNMIMATGRSNGVQPTMRNGVGSTTQEASASIVRSLRSKGATLGALALAGDKAPKEGKQTLDRQFAQSVRRLTADQNRYIASLAGKESAKNGKTLPDGIGFDAATGNYGNIALPARPEKTPSYALIGENAAPTRDLERQTEKLMSTLANRHGRDENGIARYTIHTTTSSAIGQAAVRLAEPTGVPVIAHASGSMAGRERDHTVLTAMGNADRNLGGIDTTTASFSTDQRSMKILGVYLERPNDAMVSPKDMLVTWSEKGPSIQDPDKHTDIQHLHAYTKGIQAFQTASRAVITNGNTLLEKPLLSSAVGQGNDEDTIRSSLRAAWQKNAPGFREAAKLATRETGDGMISLIVAARTGKATQPTFIAHDASPADREKATTEARRQASPLLTLPSSNDDVVDGFKAGARAAHAQQGERIVVGLPETRLIARSLAAQEAGAAFYAAATDNAPAGKAPPRISNAGALTESLSAIHKQNGGTATFNKNTDRLAEALAKENSADSITKGNGGLILDARTIPASISDDDRTSFDIGMKAGWDGHRSANAPSLKVAKPDTSMTRMLSVLDRETSKGAQTLRGAASYASMAYEPPHLSETDDVAAHFAGFARGIAATMNSNGEPRTATAAEREPGYRLGQATARSAMAMRPEAGSHALAISPEAFANLKGDQMVAVRAAIEQLRNSTENGPHPVSAAVTETSYAFDARRTTDMDRQNKGLSTESPGSMNNLVRLMKGIASKAADSTMAPYLDIRAPSGVTMDREHMQKLETLLRPAAVMAGVSLITNASGEPSATDMTNGKLPPMIVATKYQTQGTHLYRQADVSPWRAISAADSIIVAPLGNDEGAMMNVITRGKEKPIAVLAGSDTMDVSGAAHRFSPTSIMATPDQSLTRVLSIDGTTRPRTLQNIAYQSSDQNSNMVHLHAGTGRGAMAIDTPERIDAFATQTERSAMGLPATTMAASPVLAEQYRSRPTPIAVLGGSEPLSAEKRYDLADMLRQADRSSENGIHVHTTLQPGVNESVVNTAASMGIPVTVHSATAEDARTPGQARMAFSLTSMEGKVTLAPVAHENSGREIGANTSRLLDAQAAAGASFGILAMQIERNAPEVVAIAGRGQHVPVLVDRPDPQLDPHHSAGSSMLVHPDQPLQAFVPIDPSNDLLVRNGRHAITYPDRYATAMNSTLVSGNTGAGAAPATPETVETFGSAARAAQNNQTVYQHEGEYKAVTTMQVDKSEPTRNNRIELFGEHVGSKQDPSLVRFKMMEETVLDRRKLTADEMGTGYVTTAEKRMSGRLARDVEAMETGGGISMAHLQADDQKAHQAIMDAETNKQIKEIVDRQTHSRRRVDAGLGD